MSAKTHACESAVLYCHSYTHTHQSMCHTVIHINATCLTHNAISPISSSDSSLRRAQAVQILQVQDLHQDPTFPIFCCFPFRHYVINAVQRLNYSLNMFCPCFSILAFYTPLLAIKPLLYFRGRTAHKLLDYIQLG